MQYVRNVKQHDAHYSLSEKPNSRRRRIRGRIYIECTACYYENHFSSSRKVSPVNNTASKSKAQGRKIYDVSIRSVY